ncbi:MAG: Asp-tRNA(Asn)/Glu-tRNA(Gln) amidotransferase subunit GatC [Candidatus Falkowbacteria bacterium]|nr:Asp-tRNA(Asn)/Glu-tRNA(Gln) amidotransferase subunit GatC [Candidatus Falkowbacteria bacterium]
MKLEKKTIEDVARLAKLMIDEKAAEIYARQLSGIFDYIEQLKEVDVLTLAPTAQVTGLKNVMREDVVKDCEEDIIKNALGLADTIDGQIKVPRILE